ncbi:MAG: hypothetical protein RIG82_07345 [Phycisphaeraceae bacterium]
MFSPKKLLRSALDRGSAFGGKGKGGEPKPAAASRLQLEALEPRVLLTTLVGGDTFVYVDSTDNTVEVQLDGDIIVELIAAQYNPATGQIELGNLPGLIESNSLIPGRNTSNVAVFNDDGADVSGAFGSVNGGLNGTIGSTVWNSTAFIGNDLNVPNFTSPDPDDLDLQALATLDVGFGAGATISGTSLLGGVAPGAGATFAFIAGEVEIPDPTDPDAEPITQNAIFLIQIDTAEGGNNHQVIARIDEGTILSEFGVDAEDFEPVVRAADFNPLDNKLYFVVEATDVDEIDRDHLFSIDFTVDAANAVESVLNLELPGGSDPASLIDSLGGTFVSSLAFERTGTGAKLVLFVDDDDGDLGGYLTELFVDPASGAVSLVDPAIPGATPSILSRIILPESIGTGDIQFLSGVTGIEFFGDNPLGEEQFIYLVDGDDALLYRFDILAADAGVVQVMGVTTDGNPDNESGGDIEGMSYDPTTINPFTGNRGVFFATDTETDNLLILDQRFRPSTESGLGADLYMIYVVKGDAENGRIRMAVRTDDILDQTDVIELDPFGSESYDWLVTPAQGGAAFVLGQPGGSGGVLVGSILRPEGDDPENIVGNPGLFPSATNGDIPTLITYPTFYNGGIAQPGVQIVPALWDFFDGTMIGSMLQNNLDIIEEASVSSDGRFMAVVDIDGLDANGDAIAGDELAIVDLSTGEVTTLPLGVFDVNSGTALSGIQGLDFADLDGDGQEELYAIYDTSGTGGGIALVGQFVRDANGEFTGGFDGTAPITRLAANPPATGQTGADDVQITLRDGTVISVDLDSIDLINDPIQSLIDLFNNDPDNVGGTTTGLEVRGGNDDPAALNQGLFTRLEFIDRSSPLTITDLNASNLATVLGLGAQDGLDRGFNGELPDGSITSSLNFEDLRIRLAGGTPLGDIEDAAGEALFLTGGVNTALTNGLGNPDLIIETRDGSTFNIDLDAGAFGALTDASTLSDFIAALNTVQDTTASITIGTALTVSANTEGRLVFTDDTAFDGNSVFQITLGTGNGGAPEANQAARALELFSTTANNSTGTQTRIEGGRVDSVNGNLQVSVDTPVDALLDAGGNAVVIDAGNDLSITGQDGVTVNYNFAAGDTLDDVATALASDSFTLNLTPGAAVSVDDGTSAGTTLNIQDLAGSGFVDVLFDVNGGVATTSIDDNAAGDGSTTDVGALVVPDVFSVAGQSFSSNTGISVLFGDAAAFVSQVQAFAIDPATGHGFVIDNGSPDGVSLIEIDLNSGSAFRSGLIQDIGGLSPQDIVGSMDFAADGQLRIHNTATGQMVDINVDSFRSDDLSNLGINLAGTQRIALDLQDGTTNFVVDLTGATTLQGVIDLIEFSTGGDVTIERGGSSSLILTDNTAGGGTFEIRDVIGTAAAQLGINITDGGPADNSPNAGVIQGDVNFTLVTVGTSVVTPSGSLGPSIGAITFNPETGEFLGVENAVSIPRSNQEGASFESASLIRLTGDQSDDAVGQDLRDLWIGGTLTGVFNGSGSIETLYVGWLITGDATGLPEFGSAAQQFDQDFFIAGDIRDLVTSASIGGVGEVDNEGQPTFYTATDILVGGKLGRLLIANDGEGFWGTLVAVNPVNFTNGLDFDELAFSEIEGNDDDSDVPVTNAWRLPDADPNATFYAGDGRFSNDTFETAEALGSLRGGGLDGSDAVRVFGQLRSAIDDTDFVDYYSLGLLAGQTISVQLVSPGLVLGIFDADNRLVATSTSHVDSVRKFDQLFQFTTETAGEYRFAVAVPTNNTFEDGGDTVAVDYALQIFGVGNLGIGGLTATNISSVEFAPPVSVLSPALANIRSLQGDIGSVRADTGRVYVATFAADQGSIRSIDGQLLGYIDDGGTYIGDSTVGVFAGQDIGLLRAREAVTGFTFLSVVAGKDLQTIDAGGLLVANIETGGGVGVIRADAFSGDGSGGPFDFNPPVSTIRVNADNSNDGDGVIDLIDVTVNMGTPELGGPQISTGPGGNVRYIRVGGELFQDQFFGLSGFGEFRLVNGQQDTIRDDSGAVLTVAPVDTGEVLDGGDDGTVGGPDEAFLTYRTYGIRGSGGGVLVDIKSTGGISIASDSNGTGATAEVGSIFANGRGRPVLFNDQVGDGSAVLVENVNDPVNGDVAQEDLVDLYVNIGGGLNNPVDVYYIGFDEAGDDPNGTDATRGQFTSIVNNTGGEIVNVEATSIGLLSSRGNIGLSTAKATAAAVEGFVLGDELVDPAIYTVTAQPRTGVVSGSIVTVRSDQALGNFFVTGIVNTVIADADRIDNPDVFEGIVGAFFVADDQSSDILNGNIYSVNVGEGIADSGSGSFARAGLFALPRFEGDDAIILGSGSIGSIIGHDAAIYGDIYASNAIGRIVLTGDSVISGADIITDDIPAATLQFEELLQVGTGLGNGESLDNPRGVSGIPLGEQLEEGIGRIVINGTGGIIGSTIQSGRIGSVDVNNGFGIFNSIIGSPGTEGRIQQISVDGYGLLGTLVTSKGDIGNILVNGRGQQLAVTDFSTIARESETVVADAATGLLYNPFSGLQVDRYNDLHEYLGTTPDAPGTSDLSTSGVIDSSVIQTSRDVTGSIRAYQVLSTLDPSDQFPFIGGILLDIDNFGQTTPAYSYINVVGKLNRLDLTSTAASLTAVHDITRVAGLSLGVDPSTQMPVALSDVSIAGLSITAGELGTFTPGADVVGLDLTVAGEIRSLRFDGNLLSLPNIDPNLVSSIHAAGPAGTINSLIVAGDMQADVRSTSYINRIQIGGDLTGSITVDDADLRGRGLGTLILAGSLVEGGLDIDGDVSRIQIDGSAGAARNAFSPQPDQLIINGDLGTFSVGRRVVGADLALDLVVLGDLRTFDVSGQFSGGLFVGGDLSRFTVRADATTAGGTIIGSAFGDTNITVGGMLSTVSITGGHVGDGIIDGNTDSVLERVRFTAGEGINSFRVTRGDVLADASVASTLGDIRSIMVSGGDFLGDAIANAGAIGNFSIRGSDFGGLLSTRELGSFSIDGSLLTGAVIDVDEARRFSIGVDIQNGASVLLGSAGSVQVRNDHAGLLLVEDGGGRFSLNVSNDLTGQVFVGGDASIMVGGDFAPVGSVGAGTTLLALGIESSPGSSIEIQLRDGTDPITVSLAGATTIEDVINAIESTVPFVTVGIDADQEGLILTDISPNNGATFSVSDVGSSTIAQALGINTLDGGAGDRDGASNGIIDGASIGFGLTDDTVLETLSVSVATQSDLTITLRNNVTLNISLAGADTIQGVVDAINAIGGANLTAALDAGGNALELTDNTAGPGTFTISNAVGSQMATRLGLVATDGAAGDLDSALDGVILGARLSEALVFVDGNATNVSIRGAASGNFFAAGAINRFSADSMSDAVLTAGQDIRSASIRQDVTNSFVQAGILPSVDIDEIALRIDQLVPAQSITIFDPASGTDATRGEIGSFSARDLGDSVLAAGGEFGSLRLSGDMTGSSASSGIVFGVAAVRGVSDDASALANAAERNAARGTAGDRVLTHGDFGSASIGGSVSSSFITAGIDPGDDGVFDITATTLIGAPAANDSNVHTSITGGMSEIGSLRGGSFDGVSLALADTAIGSTTIPGGQQATFTFNVADIDGLAGSPIGALPATLLGTASAGTDITVAGASGTIIVRVTGDATVQVFDDNPADDVIDALVITGGSGRGTVSILDGTADSSTWQLQRVLSDDDAAISNFEFAGTVTGDGTSTTDFWFEYELRNLTLGGYASPVAGGLTGQTGGGVSSLAIDDIGAGNLVIGGEVRRFDIDGSVASPIFGVPAAAASANVTQLAFAPGNTLYTFDGVTGLLQTTVAGTTTVRVDVTDTLASGIDIDPGETITLSFQDAGADVTINLSNVHDIQDLIDAVNNQSFRPLLDGSGNPQRDAAGNILLDTVGGSLVTAALNAEGNALVFTDNTAGGGTFQITVDDPTSQLITVLGLNVTDGGVGEGSADGNRIVGRAIVPTDTGTSIEGLLGQTFAGTQRLGINLQDGSTGVVVNLTGLTTLEDVARAISVQTDQRVTVLVAGGSRLVALDNTTGGGTFSIADSAGTLGSALGIEGIDGGVGDLDAAANARITGPGLITTATQLSTLGISISGNEVLGFDFGDGTTGWQIDLSNNVLNSIGDLQGAIGVEGNNGLLLILNTAADGSRFLTLTDNGGGTGVLRASDINGTILTQLGLTGFDGGPTDLDTSANNTITGPALVSRDADLVATGVLFTGTQTLDLNLRDGSTVNVDLTGVTTLYDALNAFEVAGAGSIAAGIDASGRLVLLDNTAGGNPFTVTQTAGDAGEALGLLPPGGVAGIQDGVITTLPITPIVTLNSTLEELGIDNDDSVSINITLRNGSLFTIDLSEARTLEQVMTSIVEGTGNQVSVQFGAGGRLVLIDGTAGVNDFQISDNTGTLANTLGIAATDGIANDTDGLINGVIVAQKIVTTSTRLSTLGIDPTLGLIDVDFRDGSSTSINIASAQTLAQVANLLNIGSSGRLTLSVTADGRLQIVDGSTGAGTFDISDNGASTIAADLGIAGTDGTATDNDGSAEDGDILGNRLLTSAATLPTGISLAGAQSFDIDLRNGVIVSVDISDATTLGQIIDTINEAGSGDVTARLSVDARIVLIDNTSGVATFQVTDSAGSPAADLGFEAVDGGLGDEDGNTAADGVIVGLSLYEADSANVALSTFGIDLSGTTISIVQADGATTNNLNLSADTSVADLLAAFNGIANLSASIGLDGRLNVIDTSAGANAFRIFTAATDTGNALAQLGLEASDGGAGDIDNLNNGTITGTSVFVSSTRMSLVGLSGTGAEEIRINLQDGSNRVVDLSEALTIGDVIDAIQSQTSGDVSVTIDGNDRLQLTDNTAGAGTFSVVNLSGTPATELGILATDGGPADGDAAVDGSILGGELVAKLDATDTLIGPDLGISIDRGIDFRILLRDGGSAIEINLQGTTTLQEVVDAINAQAVRFNVDSDGVRTVVQSGLVTASLNSDGQLILTDNTAGGSAFSVLRTDVNGDPLESNTAIDLGLVANLSTTDGAVGDSDGTANGVIVGNAVPGASVANTLLSAIRSQILGLDSDGVNLYALAQSLDLNPTALVGNLFSPNSFQSLSVQAMAASAQGDIFGVVRLNGGNDTLVRVNPVTGQATTLGAIENSNGVLYRGNIEALAFTPEGQLLAIVNDADGLGGLASSLQGQAIGVLDLSDTDADSRVTIRRMTTDVNGNISTVNLPLQNLGGVLASQLGLATTDNDALRDGNSSVGFILGRDLRQPLTGNEDIFVDLGITTDGGGADDLTITLLDSTVNGNGQIGIDLDSAQADSDGNGVITLNEALAFIETATTGIAGFDVVDARLSTDLRGVILEDLTIFDDTNATNVTAAADAGASDAATLLGIAFSDGTLGVDRDNSENSILQGRDIRLAAQGTDLLSDLGITANFNRLMTYTTRSGLTDVIDLTAALTLQDVLDAVNATGDLTATISNPDILVAGLNELVTSALLIQDNTAPAFSNQFSLGAGPVAINGFAVHPDGRIFAVASDNSDQFTTASVNADTDRLITISPVDRSIANAGLGGSLIQVAATDTDIEGIGFDINGRLFAYDPTAGSVLTVDTTLNSAADATLLDNSISQGLEGFFVDPSGGRYGTEFYAFDLTDTDGNLVNDNAQLLVSSGFGTAVGTVDPTNGNFSRAAAINGTGVSLSFNSLGVGPGQGDLFVATDDGRLLQIDPITGQQIADLGVVTDQSNGQQLSISAIEFDETLNTLVGLDATRGRLVSIQLTDTNGDGTLDAALATGLMPAGSVDPASITSLNYDAASSTMNASNTSGEIVPIIAGAAGIDRVQADSFGSISIDNDFDGRIFATGNTIGTVTASGNFAGLIESNTSIRTFNQNSGNFTGGLRAGEDISSVNLRGSMLSGSISAGDSIRSVSIAGSFAGEIVTPDLGSLRVSGAAGSLSSVRVDSLGSATFSGTFNGNLILSEARSLRLDDLGAAASIEITGDLSSFTTSATASGSTVIIHGDASNISLRGTHAGLIATSGAVRSARFGEIDGGTFLAGTNLGNVSISGDMRNGLLSAGVWIGMDGIYNTADDQIFGGTLDRASIRGDYVRSAIVAGVLPSIDNGSGIPTDLRAYTGNDTLLGQNLNDLSPVDSAEAGGLLASGIGQISFGRVFGAGAGSSQASIVAAAGDIDRLTGTGTNLLITREYTDAHNAPTVVDIGFEDLATLPSGALTFTTAFITFNEEILTSSLVLAQDTNNDGDLLDLDDVRGSIAIVDSVTGAILDGGNGIELRVFRELDDQGQSRTRVEIVKPDGFDTATTNPVEIILSGSLSDTTILDRSGLRSIERDPNNDGTAEFGEDVSGTILDANFDGVEGGGSSVVQLNGFDVANDFFPGANYGTLASGIGLNTPAASVTSAFENLGDVDIFSFQANAFEFLSLDVTVFDGEAQVGLFYRDTQGTLDQSDDTYEQVITRSNIPDTINGRYTAGVELSESGEYFIAVAAVDSTSVYEIELVRASTDVNLLNLTPSLQQQTIDYVSNFIGENGNLLGFNSPKQLVYLNFEGDTVFNIFGTTAELITFDAGIIDARLSGRTDDLMIEIISRIVDIYEAIPTGARIFDGAVTPTLNVGLLGTDFTPFLSASSGVYFTLTDPSAAGLDIAYSELFFGFTNLGDPGTLGRAEQLDSLNMDKTDRAIIFAENFIGLSQATTTNQAYNEYANAFANVAAHELGHILGHNHSVAGLLSDDPDNNPLTLNNSNTSPLHLMSAGPFIPSDALVGESLRFGTSTLSPFEFPVGDIDTVDMLLRSLA